MFIVDYGRSGKITSHTTEAHMKRNIHFSAVRKRATFVRFVEGPTSVKCRRNVLNNAAEKHAGRRQDGLTVSK
jgi:hypothetical protein